MTRHLGPLLLMAQYLNQLTL